MEPNENRPKIGVGVMIFKDNKILLGKRKGSHGAGEYTWPGGHMEYMESFEQTIRRETKEETGLEIENVKFLRLLNLKAYAPKHYVDILMTADWKSGEPKVLEPNTCEGWDWYNINNLPEPLFKAVYSGVEAHKTGKIFFDN